MEQTLRANAVSVALQMCRPSLGFRNEVYNWGIGAC